MIISASRRTDIPAFYSDWFFNRWQEGRVFVRNPMNTHQVSEIRLSSDVIDCIVFWSKNPAPMIAHHSQELMNLPVPFYFQFSVNPYGKDIETNVPEKKQIFETFIALSKMIGKERVIWRYDPIIITDKIDFEYHAKYFEFIAKKLAPYTNKCSISFLDFYTKTERNMQAINFSVPSSEQKLELMQKLYDIASSFGLKLATCAEISDLDNMEIRHGKCIDPELIAHLCTGRVIAKKDKDQRKECGCIESVDIGSYNTCRHGCLYCYANSSHTAVEKNCNLHALSSPLLFGTLEPNDKIIERKMASVIDRQQTLL